jgi:hypothetical protein
MRWIPIVAATLAVTCGAQQPWSDPVHPACGNGADHVSRGNSAIVGVWRAREDSNP